MLYGVSIRIPGQITDRRTMIGELNWIFTAITDTIAWNTLPKGNISPFTHQTKCWSFFSYRIVPEAIQARFTCG